MNMTDITGKFLVAVPGMEDPNFRKSVILVCEHSGEGAFGLIINRIFMNSFKPLLSAFEIKRTLADMPVYYGGPVRPDQGYVIYSPFNKKYGTLRIGGSLGVTTSREILHDIAGGRGPAMYMLALGFSGWSSNQLEDEIIADSWLVAPFNMEIIFKVPVEERWKTAVLSLGVDIDRFCGRGGRA